jgi:hypothetical protein
VDDTPTTTDPGGAGGTPVGLAASGPARVSTAAAAPAPRAPSWVIPMIVLALFAGLGTGVAVGMLIGGADQETAVTTASTAAPTTSLAPTSTAGPADSTTTTTDAGAAPAYGVVTVSGDALPPLQDGVADAAVGLPMPEISGIDFDGNALTIADNGKAKLIVALAHWCPHCNNELPVLRDWYASAAIPDTVEVFSLTVFTDPTRASYPPSTWLRQADWNLPLIADDEARTIATTLGIPAVPFWLLVGADGTVAARFTGGLSADQLDSLLEAVVDLPETTTTTTP